VVLTNGSQMPTATADYLGADKNTHTAIGTAAAAAAAGVHHITGANPSELSANVARELSPIGGAVAVASQATFADALAGGSHISVLNGPLLLTDPQTLSPETAAAIKAASASLREVVIYGGTAAISPAVEDAIKQAMAG
jgi:putative cell wall-binding protein